MPEKSCLLEYLLSRAEALKRADGKKALSANYFLISVLEIMTETDSGKIPDEINNDEAKKELAALAELLKKYSIDNARVIEDVKGAIASPDYDPAKDELGFAKVHYNARHRVKNAGLNVIDASVYLSIILEAPTDAIRKYVIGGATDSSDGELGDELFEEMRKKLDSLISMTAGTLAESGDGDDGDSAAEEERPLPEELRRAGALSEIVKNTSKIQNKLLECIFGQDQAVNAFVSGYFQGQIMSSSREGNKKPQATFLFAGPPGVGKTFLAEKSAEALGLPYKRFDMSEYSDKEANIEFCGSDKVYKNGKAGNVTEFVSDNPKCVLLFDEIEKAHINVIYLFLQMLDAGRLRDNFTDEEVSFTDAVIIFTTNVGRNLYDDPSIPNLSAVPRKKILKALAADVDPVTKAPLFPAAICSRFASGNVVMFNHLEASNLYTIAKRELQNNVRGFEEAMGLKINIDDRVPSAIMLAEGGKADARTVKGRANAFFHDELYELFRLLAKEKREDAVERLREINVSVPLDGLDAEISSMFSDPDMPEILIFADGAVREECERRLDGRVRCHTVSSIDAASDVMFHRDISVVLCDVNCGIRGDGARVLDLEDIDSEGHDFLTYVLEKYAYPVYVLESRSGDISNEELLSFAKLGVRGALRVKGRGGAFARSVAEASRVAYQQSNMLRLARENKALGYKTSQRLSKNGRTASIDLFGFRLALITDTDDSKSIVDNVSRPDLHFDDVIGAEDAKDELKYFVDYLKDPIKYMRKGVRSPKGVLLYGPPGTGKTLLAKAMAGESGVTFLKAEGNEFLKRFVGEGAEAVHSLFAAARKYAPSIIFIDEIDAIGKDRNSMSGEGSGDVLTAFLTEMDGFIQDTSKPVFVLAATNYGVDPEKGRSLDAALLRRFDRRIYVDLPNKDERRRYLEMKLKRNTAVSLSADQLENIAVRSTGMSLAELESVFEMALRSAIRSEEGRIGDAEFEEAFETFNSGEKKEWSRDGLLRTARHEAGHALVSWQSGDKPSYLTIVARADHGGYMQHSGSEGKGSYTRGELLSRIRTALAGRASEIVYYGSEEGISTGASADLYNATAIAEEMICRYGMDTVVGMSYIDLSRASDATAKIVRDRVNSILSEELDRATRIIEENKAAVDALVKVLMDKNHLKEKEIDAILSDSVG